MSELLSLAGWYLLPDLVTGWTQSTFYAVWIRAGEPKPRPGSRLYNTHRRRINILVILAYLVYTIYEADWKLQRQGDFYSTLGVPLNVDEKGIASRFRRLTVQFHPDKIESSEQRLRVEAFYVHLKQCRDVLIDPAKRFAYDRFGPEVQRWQHCKTTYDYVFHGVRDTTMYYVGTTSVLAVLGMVGYLKHASFWRYLAIAGMFTFEVYTMTRPESPAFIRHLLNPAVTVFGTHPPYVQYQVLALLRKLLISFFIALSQIGPLLSGPTDSAAKGGDAATAPPSSEQLDRLASLADASEQEASRLMALELMPFTSEGGAMAELRSAVRQWLVDNTVRAHPEVRDAMGRALRPRGSSI